MASGSTAMALRAITRPSDVTGSTLVHALLSSGVSTASSSWRCGSRKGGRLSQTFRGSSTADPGWSVAISAVFSVRSCGRRDRVRHFRLYYPMLQSWCVSCSLPQWRQLRLDFLSTRFEEWRQFEVSAERSCRFIDDEPGSSVAISTRSLAPVSDASSATQPFGGSCSANEQERNLALPT
jgi:hypothetical protein